MAKNKKKADKKAEKAKPEIKEEKANRMWSMQPSQRALLVEADKRYHEEQEDLIKHLKRYQNKHFMELLVNIKRELGIPENVDTQFVSEAMAMVEVPPQPKPSPTTQDLTKTPA